MLNDNVQRLAGGANYAARISLMPDGQPQSQMSWVGHDGEHVLLNTEGDRQVVRNVERDPRITVMIFAAPYEFCEVRGRVVEIVRGAEARDHIDELARKYTGADYANPVGPGGRVILKVKPDKENTFG